MSAESAEFGDDPVAAIEAIKEQCDSSYIAGCLAGWLDRWENELAPLPRRPVELSTKASVSYPEIARIPRGGGVSDIEEAEHQATLALAEIDSLRYQRDLLRAVVPMVDRHFAAIDMDTPEDNALIDEIRRIWTFATAGARA